MKCFCSSIVLAAWSLFSSLAAAAPPTAADSRLIIELIAQEPDIVTPTGVAVDESGRIWVIENNTHQRPAKYKGPPSDRIRIFEDFGPDGKARKITTWAEGFKDTMGIALGKNGDVFVATRAAIYLLHDVQGKGQADEKLVLARLETTTTYPHNGLSGFAIDALGEIYFGLGENFGATYKLIGRDNATLTGGGEGGSIYRMKPDGGGLKRIATGFWNPFAMAFDRWGRLFAVDNDPDARGPCRLLHIIQYGDFGYRFKYGRKGIHPFQSWNGELPGTLPMVAGTAEAPSGIVAYESSGLPEDYRGKLLVTSWGDHVIEQFQLEPRGASFGATKKVIVRGGEDFRPVGIAIAPDGSLIVSDWVDKSYPVHGKGKLWRIRAKDAQTDTPLSVSHVQKQDAETLKKLLSHPRREYRMAAAETLASQEKQAGEVLLPVLKNDPQPIARLHALWAMVSSSPTASEGIIAVALLDPSPEVRAEAAALAGRVLTLDEVSRLRPTLSKLIFKDASAFVRVPAIQTAVKIQKIYFHIELTPFLSDDDPFVVSAAVSTLSNSELLRPIILVSDMPARQRLGYLLAFKRMGRSDVLTVPQFLRDDDPAIRRAAIQWVAEEGLHDYAKLLDEAAAKLPVTRELFEAWLAAKELLANPGMPKNASNELGGDAFVLKVIADAKQPPTFRALALRMLPPEHAKLKLSDLLALVKDADPELRAEAVKTLTWRSAPAAQQALRGLASDEAIPLALRGDAVLGLALSATNDAETRQLLLKLLKDGNLAQGALRSLRGALSPADGVVLGTWWQGLQATADDRENLAEQILLTRSPPAEIKLTTPRPDTAAAWRELLLKAKGDPAAGERVFFHSKGPRCFACHKIDGRGEAVGPDLSRIGAAMNREKLIESILEPSKEIAPAFVTWLVTTHPCRRPGKTHDLANHRHRRPRGPKDLYHAGRPARADDPTRIRGFAGVFGRKEMN
jgi:putative membrane-bound dehydrogenase-like protein